MGSHNTFVSTAAVFIIGITLGANTSWAQSDQYKPKKKAAAADSTTATPAATDSTAAAKPADQGGDKLDIKDLEQKYWAPKDTDFSVVQNRTYSKANRLALSVMTGPIVNDPFNSGYNYELEANYYFDERYGVQAMYIKDDLSNSKNTNDFMNLSGGGVLPDYNRDTSFYGVGFNWVPFYAKMSFLGKKIIYFDMQITPTIGMSNYEQITSVGNNQKSAFAYGYDITQFYFFSNNWAIRADLHNEYYGEKVVSYGNGVTAAGTPVRSDTANTTTFMIGITYFFGDDVFSRMFHHNSNKPN
jgi:outer membrane beta-barrel protein